MPPMGAANGCDLTRVTVGGQPVVDRRANRAARDGRLARTVVTGDQEHDPLPSREGVVEGAVDRSPRAIEAESVKVDDPVGLGRAAPKAAIPAAVERGARSSTNVRCMRTHPGATRGRFCHWPHLSCQFNFLVIALLTR
jgi:hypothetical protein